MATKCKTYEPLDELLKSSGMKYEAIAERVGLTYAGLYRVRLCPGSLTLERIFALQNACGLKHNEIYDLLKNFPF